MCSLLADADKYIQYKCTKLVIQKVIFPLFPEYIITSIAPQYSQVIQYVDRYGNEVLSLGSFTLLPYHVVHLILSRFK